MNESTNDEESVFMEPSLLGRWCTLLHLFTESISEMGFLQIILKSTFLRLDSTSSQFHASWLIEVVNTESADNFSPRTRASPSNHYLRKRLDSWLELMARLQMEAIKFTELMGLENQFFVKSLFSVVSSSTVQPGLNLVTEAISKDEKSH